MQWKVQLFQLNYDQREYDAVLDTLRSGWITMGPKTQIFEAAYAEELGEGSMCLAVANGTAALHMAVLAAGIGPGDEVIVPSLTFIADLNSVRVSGAEVVLADVTSVTDWSMDPTDIEAKITPRTKAVMIVHYAGYACDMDPIVELCRRHKVILIEDCAHANGGTYRGRKLGTFGELSAWSFFSNKNLAVGEGGLVAVRDENLFKKCKNLRSHGMTVASFDRMQGRAANYDVVEPGFNYRIDEIRASLGLVQLSKLKEANAARAQAVNHYFQRLDEIDDLIIPFRSFDRGIPTYHIMPVLLPEGVDRARVIEAMKEDGIQTSIHYPAIQGFSAYKGKVRPTPTAEYICEHELTLPLYPSISKDQIDMVCDSLIRSLHKE
ncbi:MAG: DegT/DnrJ/EryC1/StrS family aminotransferase [Spirochaetia bacterium]|jgi:dTDP-4-amino-4,6-dideoxygalactose transaminase|nr:DegT/DnrJ/EryC1/StrS family aminotransferase [Spirochaetia bacterium]